MSLTAALMGLSLITAPQSATPDLSWMSGYWLDCTGGREASETWSDQRNGLMAGHAISIENGRGSFEISTIRPTAQGLTYMAQPGGAAPTPFVLTDSGPTRAVFENPQNDFPTRVIYERTGDRLNARIEGTMGGEARSMEWTFTAEPLNTRCPS